MGADRVDFGASGPLITCSMNSTKPIFCGSSAAISWVVGEGPAITTGTSEPLSCTASAVLASNSR